MKAGALRHRVDIERQASITNDGYGNTRAGWSTLYAGVPAAITPLYNAHEMYAGAKVETLAQYQLLIRYLPNITAKMRVKWGNRYLNITGTINKEERNVELTLLCESAIV